MMKRILSRGYLLLLALLLQQVVQVLKLLMKRMNLM